MLMRLVTLASILLILNLAGCGGDGGAEKEALPIPDYLQGEILVGIDSAAVRPAASVPALIPGAVETGRIDLSPIPAPGGAAPQAVGAATRMVSPTILRLRLPPGLSVAAALKSLEGRSDIRYAEPNYRVRRAAVPDDPFFSRQWGLQNVGQTITGNKGTFTGTIGADIEASVAWDRASGDRSVTVAVIDSGIDYEHPDLVANIWRNPGETGVDALGRDKGSNAIDDDGNGYIDDVRGWNFIGRNSRPLDDDVDGHGTHVAGVIGATGNDGTGVAGINWQVQLMPLKFLDRYGRGDLFNAVAAYNYAVRHGARVVNASYTYPQSCTYVSPSIAERDAIAAAGAAGVLVVAAAGNFGCNNDIYSFYPGSHPLDNILSVAGTTPNDGIISWSNYGPASVDMGAPGLNIYSTVRQALRGLDGAYGYDYLSGTSMAAPHVSGAAALLWGFNPSLTLQEARDALLLSVDPVADLTGRTVSGGRLNIARALSLDTVSDPPVAPTELSVDGFSAEAVNLSWRDNSDTETFFVVERRSIGEAFAQIGQVPADEYRFSDTAPPDGRETDYRVKAVAGLAASDYSNIATVLIPLRAPDGLIAFSGTRGVYLGWRDRSGAEETFTVERRVQGKDDFTVLVTVGTNTTEYTDASATAGVIYSYRVRASNTVAGHSEYTPEVTGMIPLPSSGGGGGGSGCFIATAAWGTPFAGEIDNLRRFRDRVLLPTRPGSAFVEFYYRWSPPVADFIADHEALRTVVRWALQPLAYLAGQWAPADSVGSEADRE